MRILGGDAKGRTVRIKRDYLSGGLRPTSQKVRKALFDILQDRIFGAVFLDLFAGTGAVGIEAISRGAERVVSVEQSRKLIKNIKNNVDMFEIKDKIKIIQEDVSSFLRKSDEGFDIIFADPPYDYGGYTELIGMILDRQILNNNAILVIEHFSKINIFSAATSLGLKKSYKYGDTTLSFFTKRGY